MFYSIYSILGIVKSYIVSSFFDKIANKNKFGHSTPHRSTSQTNIIFLSLGKSLVSFPPFGED